jgi:hypothetical protein
LQHYLGINRDGDGRVLRDGLSYAQ